MLALDSKSKAFLDQLVETGAPAFHQLTPEENRNAMLKIVPTVTIPSQSVDSIQEQFIPVKDGEIKVRIYTPKGEGNFPILVYFHGGGFVFGDLEMVDAPLRAITNAAKCIVISVDYRLAPEHSFPTAAEDAYSAVKWVAENAHTFSGDSRRIAVAGDSAGGNLAAVVCLMAREQGSPTICFQALLYPCTDFSKDHLSKHHFAEGYFLSREDMKYFEKQYFRTEEEKKNIYASPLLADDLSGLPDALVVTAGYDPLRDEGQAYANRLNDAGVKVKYHCYDDTIHGFFILGGVIDQGKELIEEVSSSLKSVFSRVLSPGE
jgi:acetyl esterase